MLLDKSGETGPERMKRLSQRKKQCPAVDVTGNGSKVRCCKEQYFIGTWNVRSVNQGKLEVVKQEMARVNTDILGISELKWTGMGEFNSDDHYIYSFRTLLLTMRATPFLLREFLPTVVDIMVI